MQDEEVKGGQQDIGRDPSPLLNKDKFQTMANNDMQKIQNDMNGLNLNTQ